MSAFTPMYESLCEKLSTFGYNQSLPLAAVPLVNEMLTDFIQTTQSLREVKKYLEVLLEEKNCWELGIEPYKCDNSRLLKELNEQCAENLEITENYEIKLHELQIKVGNLQAENNSLLDEIQETKNQGKTYPKLNASTYSKLSDKQKKAGISTVKPSGKSPLTLSKTKSSTSGVQSRTSNLSEIKRLDNMNKELKSQIETQKKLIDTRDKEIKRLTDLLVGGRSPAALARDCCYKEVAAMSEDINRLQAEKSELIGVIHQYENKMQEAMQRSIELSKLNTNLKKEMDTLKSVAFEVEDDANLELAEQENEITKLNSEIGKLSAKCAQLEKDLNHGCEGCRGDVNDSLAFKSLLERYNKISRIAIEQKLDNQRLVNKIKRQKELLEKLDKEVKEVRCSAVYCEEEKNRLKLEKERLCKEFLHNVVNIGAQDEVTFLQQYIGKKDEELRKMKKHLRSTEWMDQDSNRNPIIYTVRTSDCIERSFFTPGRKHDFVPPEAKKLRCEQVKGEELENVNLEKEDINARVKELRVQQQELLKSEINLLKEEIEEFKRQLEQMKAENMSLNFQYNQLKSIQVKTQKTLMEDRSQLAAAGRQVVMAEDTINTLTEDIAKLTKTYISMEQEKDKLLDQLDDKAAKIHFLQNELKVSEDQRRSFAEQIEEMEGKLSNEKKDKMICVLELHETSSEVNSLRQEIVFSKETQHRLVDENIRLSKELAECNSEMLILQEKFDDADSKNKRLKKQLHHSVQEVKAAEEFLLEQEKEREEMLEEHHSLTLDAVPLEDNNENPEFRLAEKTPLINEMETEIEILNKTLNLRDATVSDLEKKMGNMNTLVFSLVNDLDRRQMEKDKCGEEIEKLKVQIGELLTVQQRLEIENEFFRKRVSQEESEYEFAEISDQDEFDKSGESMGEQIKNAAKENNDFS